MKDGRPDENPFKDISIDDLLERAKEEMVEWERELMDHLKSFLKDNGFDTGISYYDNYLNLLRSRADEIPQDDIPSMLMKSLSSYELASSLMNLSKSKMDSFEGDIEKEIDGDIMHLREFFQVYKIVAGEYGVEIPEFDDRMDELLKGMKTRIVSLISDMKSRYV